MLLKKVRPYFDIDSRLREVPLDWLRLIEHKIIRKGVCWLWQGMTDHYGEPIIKLTQGETGGRTQRRCKVVVMRMFWEGLNGHEIIHSCGNNNCLNPKHLIVSIESWRNKMRKSVIREKSARINRYVNKEKNP